jgi:hypothetical protein
MDLHFGGTLVSAQWRVTVHIQLFTTINQLTMLPSPVAVSLFFLIGEFSPKKRNLKMT